MTARINHRDNCRLCLSKNVHRVVELAPIPLAEKYSTSTEEACQVEKFPVDLYLCSACGHVQVLDVIDSDTLWDDYTYHSGQTKGIVDHFNDVATKVLTDYATEAGSLVIDVGSNDGSLLRQFKDRGYRVMGIDPAREIARKATESGIETIADLLTPESAQRIIEKAGKAKIITAFNVFAHADNMNQMAACIADMLDDSGIFVFEVQYLVDIIEKFLLGTIFHEHMSHHSLKPMKRFLESHNLEIIDVERVSIQKGSIIGIAQKKGGARSIKLAVKQLLDLEEQMHLDKPEAIAAFNDKLARARSDFDALRKQWDEEGAQVAAFGAARSGPTFTAQFGIGNAIKTIFDDHPQKVHKFSPGDGIPVRPTSELYTIKPDYVVILAWIHAKKIIASHEQYLNEGGKFVVCCPEVQVIDRSTKANLL